MNINEYTKNKANELVEQLKQKMITAGVPMSERDEYFFRMGMSQGISLSAFTLGSIPVDITLDE